MANPNFPSDGQGERTDALVSSLNAATFKLGVGSVVPTGGGTDAAWAGVATHEEGLPVLANDGVVLVAGEARDATATPVAVDPGGGLQLATYAHYPRALALVATTGSLGAGTYAYRVTATTSQGESTPCPEVAISVGASAGVTLDWSESPGATGYRVYGRTSGGELLMATITNGTTLTWTDSGSVTPSGAMPTANTALATLLTTLIVAQTSSTSALTSVAGSASSVTLLAANSSRKGAAFYNDSTANLYLALSTTASATAYTVRMTPGSYYELPLSALWLGAVAGIWDSAAGNCRITELS